MSEWTIAVITSWDDDPPDTLYEDMGTVEAETLEDAETKYGEAHPYERHYCTISARPKGTDW